MKLRTLKKEYMYRMSLMTLVLSVIVGLVYYLYLPHRYFVCFPFIPAFFFLAGWGSVSVLLFFYKYRPQFVVSGFLVMKTIKFILSVVFILIYQLLVGHEIVGFSLVFLVFYFAFLICETCFLVRVELEHKEKMRMELQMQSRKQQIKDDIRS